MTEVSKMKTQKKKKKKKKGLNLKMKRRKLVKTRKYGDNDNSKRLTTIAQGRWRQLQNDDDEVSNDTQNKDENKLNNRPLMYKAKRPSPFPHSLLTETDNDHGE